MKYLLIGGAPDTGKTSFVRRISIELTTRSINTFVVVAGAILPTGDFIAILEGPDSTGNIVRVLVNSPSDTKKKVNELRDFLKSNAPVDIVISSIRDMHTPRVYFIKTIISSSSIIEIPLGKIRKGKHKGSALAWYESTLDSLSNHLLSQNPFNL